MVEIVIGAIASTIYMVFGIVWGDHLWHKYRDRVGYQLWSTIITAIPWATVMVAWCCIYL